MHISVVIQRHDLRTSYEEADIIIPQQVVHIASLGMRHIPVVCDDTDVFLLLLHYYHHKKLSCGLLMEGMSSKRTSLDIAATAKKPVNIVPQLLAAHALSGYDAVAYREGYGSQHASNGSYIYAKYKVLVKIFCTLYFHYSPSLPLISHIHLIPTIPSFPLSPNFPLTPTIPSFPPHYNYSLIPPSLQLFPHSPLT